MKQVLAELRSADKLLLTTHENPDGDALGSLLAMHWILEQLGKDSLMFMSPDEFPLPWEYRGWTFERLAGTPPDDVAERTIVFLDCGNIDRMPVDFLQADGLHILNIDHHHDNTRFGTVNLVVPERLLHRRDRLATSPRSWAPRSRPRSPTRSTPALVTDTGKFMYENTTPEAHRMAAELIEAGVAPHEVYRRLYEDLPFRRLQLLQRALASVERHDDGAITIAHLVKDDYEETGAQETDSEGVVDHLRAVEGTAVAVLVRELLSDDRDGMRKVSLRATDGRVDVSRIAREFGGGGHPQAAGFATALPYARAGREAARRSCASSSQLTAPQVLLRAKPAGVTSHDVVAEVRRSLPRGTKVGHAGTLDPFATGLLLVLVGRATRAQRFLMGLPKTYRAVARLGWTSDTGDRDGELDRDRPHARTGSRSRSASSCSARPPTRRSRSAASGRYARARRGEAVETASRARDRLPRRAALARGRPRRLRDRVLRRHLRAHAGRRPRRRLLRGARAHRDRPVPARGRRPRAARAARRGARLPARARALPRTKPRAVRHGRRIAAADRRSGGQADGGRRADRDRASRERTSCSPS